MSRKILITTLCCVVAALSLISSGSRYHDDNQQTKNISSSLNELQQQATTTSRHLLVVDPSNRKPPSDIQYAAFGTSITYGVGLQHRRRDAYVKRLSSHGVNFGIRGSGPNYPSACLHSMIGDRHFDVIILEFFSIHQGFDVLVRRLRERFPDAIIIILREWFPLTISTLRGVSAKQWVEQKFGSYAFHLPKMHHKFKASNMNWVWNSPEERYRVQVQENIAKRYGAIVLPMSKPSDPRSWVDFAHLFTPDFLHKSDRGHEEMAERIRTIVDRLGVPTKPRQGKWTSVDWCHNWFHSGDVSAIGHNSQTMPLRPFADGSKYALELHVEDSPIKVRNPSGEYMRLYVEYMVKSPCCYYPRVKVSMKGRERFKSVTLEQVAPSYYGTMPVHVTVMQYVGMIPPGRSLLHFTRLEKKKEWPFRLVSIAVTSEELIFVPATPIPDQQRI